MSQRGSGLLDAIAATAIGLMVANAATDTVAAVRALGVVEDRDRLLVTARNLLEQAIGTPCAPTAACPSDMTCTIAREIVTPGPPALARLRVSVETLDDGARVPPVRLVGVSAESCT